MQLPFGLPEANILKSAGERNQVNYTLFPGGLIIIIKFFTVLIPVIPGQKNMSQILSTFIIGEYNILPAGNPVRFT